MNGGQPALLPAGESCERDWDFIAEQPAPAPHLAHLEGCAALCVTRGSLQEGVRVHLTQSAFKVVLQKSIPPQIRQPILHISNSKGEVDGFAGELTFAE